MGLEGVATLSLRGGPWRSSRPLRDCPGRLSPVEGHAPRSKGIKPSEVPLRHLPWNKPDSGRSVLPSVVTSGQELRLTELEPV